MRLIQKWKLRLHSLSIRERLVCSNILMFLIPVAVTIVSAIAALGVAFYAFARFWL